MPAIQAAREAARRIQCDNRIRQVGVAVINYRLLPGDSLDDLRAHVRGVVNDPRVKISYAPGKPNIATPVSPVDSESFRHIAASVRAVFPQVVVAPSLVIPATDARYYGTLTDNTYRLLPIVVTTEDLNRFHGIATDRWKLTGAGDCRITTRGSITLSMPTRQRD